MCNACHYKKTRVGNGEPANQKTLKFKSNYKSIHVFVALCDNEWQGIVPVPAAIGNGDDADNNLYWGGMYGMRTYFNKSSNWQLVKKYAVDSVLLERLIYKHRTKPYYLIADAYRGKYIKQCTINYLNACAGTDSDTLKADRNLIGLYGNASLLAYIGHDGLMDFSLPDQFINTSGQRRDAMVFACLSNKYFSFHLQAAKTRHNLLTTGLMCPEAYTLHSALNAYIANSNNWHAVKDSAASAYAKYQRCDKKAADLLFHATY